MKLPRKYLFFLLLLDVIVALAGYLVFLLADIRIKYSDVLLLLAGFSVISVVTVVIFHMGRKKDPQGNVFYTLVSMGLKILLDLIIALIWFVLAKKKFDNICFNIFCLIFNAHFVFGYLFVEGTEKQAFINLN